MRSVKKLTAILFADIQGYTALMQKDEKAALALLKRYQDSLSKEVMAHGGEIIKQYGDGGICLFPSASGATHAALQLQLALQEAPGVPLRIGLHLGDVTFSGEDVYGDAINLTSRIESMGVPGSVLLSRSMNQKVKNQAEFRFQSLGSFHFKNIEEPMEVFALANGGIVIPARKELKGKFGPDKKGIKKKLIWIIPTLLLTLIGIGYGFWGMRDKEPIDPYNYTNSIAFLPLDDLSSSGDQQDWADAFVTELIALMSQAPQLKVINHISSFSFRDKDISLKEIGNRLDVQYLVNGSFVKMGERLNLNLFLIDANTGENIMSFEEETTENDMFDKQEEIVLNLGTQINMNLTEDYFERSEIKNLETYLLNKKAWHKKQLERFNEVEPLLMESLKIDSINIRTIYQLIQCYVDLTRKKNERAEVYIQSANYYTEKLLKIDSTSKYALASKANMALLSMDYDKMVHLWEEILTIYSPGIEFVSEAGFNIGLVSNPERGIEICERALELDPLYVVVHRNLQELYWLNQEYEKWLDFQLRSNKVLDRGIDENSIFSTYYLLIGEYDQALKRANKLGEDLYRSWDQIHAYYGLGNMEKMEELLTKHIEKYQDSATNFAYLYSYINQKEEAFKYLELAIRNKESLELRFLKYDTNFKNLHADPRWIPLLKRLNFPEPLSG